MDELDTTFLLGTTATRLACCFGLSETYIADEYWQSLEVAHKLAFGYGHLTWEWREKTKSYIYPFMVSIIYKILAILRLDDPLILNHLPRVLQAVFSGFAEYRYLYWARNTWASLSLATTYHWYLYCSKAMPVSFETNLMIIALSLYTHNGQDKNIPTHDCKFLWIAGLLCALEPAMLFIWVPLFIEQFETNPNHGYHLTIQYIKVAVITVAYSIAIDSYCYGTFIFTLWNYFESIPWNKLHIYYLIPLIWHHMDASILPVCFLLITAICRRFIKPGRVVQNFLTVFMLIVWSEWMSPLIESKYLNIILPSLPLVNHFITRAQDSTVTNFQRYSKGFMMLILVVHNMMARDSSILSRTGPYKTLDVLKTQLETLQIGNHYNHSYAHGNYQKNELDLLLLTPCDAFPLHSYLHMNITAKFLTCEPQSDWSHTYAHEADRFFNDSMGWIYENYDIDSKNFNPRKLPAFVIIFEKSAKMIPKFLKYYELIDKKPYLELLFEDTHSDVIDLYAYIY